VENAWQFLKVYPKVAKQRQKKKTKGGDLMVWEHPAEKHAQLPPKLQSDPDFKLEDVKVLPAWKEWSSKGMKHKLAVRRPNGTVKKNGPPLFSMCGDKRLTYIAARKEIYMPLYSEALRRHPLYAQLLGKLRAGKSILLIDLDGPCVEQFPNGQKATPEMLQTALHNPLRPFGHGYVAAWALLHDLVVGGAPHAHV